MIKTGGRLVRHARRLVFQLAEVLVSREMLCGILERIGRFGWLLASPPQEHRDWLRLRGRKRGSQGGDLGVDQRFGDFRLGRTVVAI